MYFEKIFSESLTLKDFQRLSSLVFQLSGINLGEEKRVMVEGRLRKRIHALKMDSYKSYMDYLFSSEGREKELSQFIDAITTNKTDFFREPKHFEFLSGKALSEIVNARPKGYGQKKIQVWSAGCSTGEEPYTLGIVLSEFGANDKSFSFKILATDICTEVLKTASLGIYEFEKVKDIPESLLKKYFLKGKGDFENYVRVSPIVRESVRFEKNNLLDIPAECNTMHDIIFCRNVLIYFDRATQEKVVHNLISHLNPGGFLFIGHSESLTGIRLPVERVISTVYKKK